MIVIFSGAESADHRHTLESVRDMFETPPRIVAGINFKQLRTRRQTAKYVAKTTEIFPTVLTSGYEHATSGLEAREEYYRMVEEVPAITYAVQFHAEDTLVPEGERIVPLTNGSDFEVVQALMLQHGAIAMEYQEGDDPRIPGLLRSIPESVASFAISMSHSDLVKAKTLGFRAVATSMWLNPGRFGEVQFWDGSTFHRTKDKEAFLRRFLPNVEAAGFDPDLVSRHDTREMVRLAAWSLVSWSQHLAPLAPSDVEASDTSAEVDSQEVAERHLASVLTFPDTSRHPSSRPTTQVARTGPPDVTRRAAVPLPVFASTQEVVLDEDADGTPSVTSRMLLQTNEATIRTCDTCHLASVCPAFIPASSCAYNFPVEVRTDAQVRALLATMVEMQAARVAFARFGEELKGGYPDPVVGAEMDRLIRLTDKVMKPNERRERLTLSVETETSGGMQPGGVLSRIFGAAPTPRPPEITVSQVIDADDVTDT